MSGTYSQLIYHIVFSTKLRRPLISSMVEDELFNYVGGIIRNMSGLCLEINGTMDHIHLLAKLPPKLAISDALREIKANSSRWLRQDKRIQKFAWQDGYAAFSASRSSVPSLSRYIRNQKQHHNKRDFKSELIDLLERHDVDYDERFIWN